MEAEPYSPFGQHVETEAKYREAIFACYDISYIQMTVSEVAHHFGVSPTGLGNQLRNHFPDLCDERENIRKRLGCANNIHHGALPGSVAKYSKAVKMLDETDLTVQEVAQICDVSPAGLRQHVIYYHKHIAERRHLLRVTLSKKGVLIGEKNGINRYRGPKKETIEKYSPALELYRTTSLSLEEIALRTDVSLSGLRSYLHSWHKSDVVRRRGIEEYFSEEDLRLIDSGERVVEAKRYSPSTAEKYAPAMKMIQGGASLSEAARCCGFPNTDNLRWYLRKHDSSLLAKAVAASRITLPEGTSCPVESWNLFKDAVNDYVSTDEPLKSIARRYGLRHTSLRSFLGRNFPKAVALRREKETGKTEQRKADSQARKEACEKRRKDRMGMTAAKYADSIAAFATGEKPLAQVAEEFGLNKSALGTYVRTHYPGLVENRRKVRAERVAEAARQREAAQAAQRKEWELRKAQCRLSVIPKYEPAVAEYSEGNIGLKPLADKFGLCNVSLRNYIGTRYPELIRARAEAVQKELDAKYSVAVEEMLSSTDSIEVIARRNGLSRNALRNYIKQHRPHLMDIHKAAMGKK